MGVGAGPTSCAELARTSLADCHVFLDGGKIIVDSIHGALVSLDFVFGSPSRMVVGWWGGVECGAMWRGAKGCCVAPVVNKKCGGISRSAEACGGHEKILFFLFFSFQIYLFVSFCQRP